MTQFGIAIGSEVEMRQHAFARQIGIAILQKLAVVAHYPFFVNAEKLMYIGFVDVKGLQCLLQALT